MERRNHDGEIAITMERRNDHVSARGVFSTGHFSTGSCHVSTGRRGVAISIWISAHLGLAGVHCWREEGTARSPPPQLDRAQTLRTQLHACACSIEAECPIDLERGGKGVLGGGQRRAEKRRSERRLGRSERRFGEARAEIWGDRLTLRGRGTLRLASRS